MTALPLSSLPQGSIALSDFGVLQERYKPLPPPARATAMLEDAASSLAMLEAMLEELKTSPQAKAALTTLRGSLPLLGKLRASEAKNQLTDESADFMEATLHKLAAWKKTLERLAGGEGAEGAVIKASAPLAVTLMKPSGLSGYLSIIQLMLGEMGRQDDKNASHYAKATAQIRRCSTVLSDCESAADLAGLIR